MRSVIIKSICLQLLLSLLLGLGGCGKLKPSGEVSVRLDSVPAEEDGEEELQSIGEALRSTYAADHVFSLNAMLDDSFNPYVTSSAWNQVVGMLVYENLVELDDDFEARPNLVTAWSTEDGYTWTFSVDTSRVFHNGDAVTAYDAVYSIQQAMAVGSRYERRFRNVGDISAIDRDTFTVTLDEANYRFYQLLNVPCIEYYTGWEDTPPGTGPYQFSAAGNYLTLDEDHPKAAEMPLDTVYLKEYTAAEDILQAFEDSYIDLVINNSNAMSSLGYASTNITKYVDTTSMHYLGYNTTSGVFTNPVLRAVLTYAIDRAGIVSDIMEGAGVAATLPIHPDSALYPTEYARSLAYSQEGFARALENIGAVDLDGDGTLELNGQRYTINFIVCSDSAVKVFAARRIAQEMQSRGLSVNLRELSYEDYLENLEEGNFDIYYGEVMLCTDWDLSLFFQWEGELNLGGLSDNTLLSHVKTFLASTDDTREMNAGLMYQYIGQNAPITVICFEKSEVLYHRGVLAGLSPTQDNLFYGMENWTVDLHG